MAFVTSHAASRYVERISPHLTQDQARAEIMLSAPAIDRAAGFGASIVRLANGARLVLNGDTVATVKTMRERRSVPLAMLKRFGKARRRGKV